MWLGVYSNDALGFWQGGRFIRSGEISVGDVVSTLMALILSTYALSNMIPHFRSITTAIGASRKIFATIDRESSIDSSSNEGIKLEKVKGDIELKNVRFIYPSRPNVTVLDNYSLHIPAGKTVALVGASGSGKSTIIGLLERFYHPLAGDVLLDGVDVKNLNIRWLRQQIALVSQEPSLFSCSIYENIAHGLIGTKHEFASEIEKRKLVTEACEQANAMSFINTFPEGLDTNVGERGFLMSGGQKQRIAIARGIVSNPKILLLDEATSALDTKSEGVVQEALDRASKNRTTIVIAHRLSTIKDADNIVVMRKGVIVEQGTHDELIAKNGDYFQLVEAQRIEKQKEKMAKAQGDYEDDENEDMDDLEMTKTMHLTRTRTAKSVSSVVLANKPVKEEVRADDYSLWTCLQFLYMLSEEDKSINFAGVMGSLFTGISYDLMGLFFGKCVQAYGVPPSEYDYMTEQIAIYAGLFFMLAVVQMIVTAFSWSCFALSTQRLVRRIRLKTFRNMVRQDISFFDMDENTTGSLTSMLSQDAQFVEGMSIFLFFFCHSTGA